MAATLRFHKSDRAHSWCTRLVGSTSKLAKEQFSSFRSGPSKKCCRLAEGEASGKAAESSLHPVEHSIPLRECRSRPSHWCYRSHLTPKKLPLGRFLGK